MQSNRRAFLKESCAVCSCLSATMLLAGSAGADEPSEAEQALKQQIDQTTAFAGAWTSSLMQIMDKELESEDIVTILEACGSACAERNSAPLITAYANDLDGLLGKMKELWLESYEHNSEEQNIQLTGRQAQTCPCPIHPAGNSSSYCECSNGHMKHMFSEVIGKPVDVTLTESVLRGGERCSWKISYRQT